MASLSVGWPSRQLAGLLRNRVAPAGVQLELWDGSTWYSGTRPPIGTLVFHTPRALRGVVLNPHLQFGECYMHGTLDVRGPLAAVLEALSRLSTTPTWRERLALHLTPPNSLRRARRNVHHHYDLGNDFYQQWLDEQLVYTCAYFDHPGVPLEEAQVAKMELVCRKLALRSGETVVEAGCGWGALALHMARRYGVRVKAFNVSREQIAYARARAAREGLASQVEFLDEDYRNVRGQCDVFVSVGMLEHVGRRHYRSLASVMRQVVRRSGGRGLLHFIGRDIPRVLNPWTRRRIFPGGYPPTLAEVATKILAPARMSMVDVENLRLHYARTLAHWNRRFAGVRDQVHGRYGETFRRAWELYLSGSEAAFASGSLQLFQVVFAPFETAPPFWTRAEIYRRHGLEGASAPDVASAEGLLALEETHQ